jgi:hypothetical protein
MFKTLCLAALFGFSAICVGCNSGTLVDDDISGDDDTAGDDDTTGDDDTSPDVTEDVFVQQAQPTDVLFVVDNSCSMQEEQDALVGHFEGFLQHMVDTGVDFHIGITVLDDWQTQPPIGELFGNTAYIDPDTPEPMEAFAANMTMGADGMGACEVGLEATYRALTPPFVDGPNADFYREEARLAVFVVSDEIDGSIAGCEAIGDLEFTWWFMDLKPDGIESVYFAAIIGNYPNGCSSEWGEADPGRGYHEVAEALGWGHASEQSICQQDWSWVMDLVGEWAAAVPTSFELSEVPLEGTLDVFLDTDDLGPEPEVEIFEDPTYQEEFAFVYDVESNSLDFQPNTAPPAGARLRVTYEVEG